MAQNAGSAREYRRRKAMGRMVATLARKPYVAVRKQIEEQLLDFVREWLAAPRDKKIFDAPQKIIVRQTGDSIIATIIEGGIICRDNLHICVPKQGGNRGGRGEMINETGSIK